MEVDRGKRRGGKDKMIVREAVCKKVVEFSLSILGLVIM